MSIVRRAVVTGALLLGLSVAPALAQKSQAQQDWEKTQADALAANAKKPGWKTAASGLQYHRVKANPKGTQPGPDTSVTIAYVGKNGADNIFDQSDSFDLKVNEMVKGMREGLQMMRAGETWDFAMPAELGYGDRSGPGRPAGSALFFHVTLLKAQK